MAVTKRVRYEVLRRDNFTCRYCGGSAPDVRLVVDHVLPEVLGGKSEPSNLVAACEPCNSGKTSTTPDGPLVEDVKQDAIRWARAMQIAAQGAASERDERDQFRQAFLDKWNVWKVDGEFIPLPIEWPNTIDAFSRAGLEATDIADAVDIAMRKQHIKHGSLFKYFCGICWRMLDDRRETATALVDILDWQSRNQ